MSLMKMRKRIRERNSFAPFFRGRASWGLLITCFAVSIFCAASSFRVMQKDYLGLSGFVLSIIFAIAGASQWRRLSKASKSAPSATEKRRR